MSQRDILRIHLKALSMPTAVSVVDQVLEAGERENWSLETVIREILEREIEGRRQHRVERLAKTAALPAGKTLASLDTKRLPLRIQRQLPQLCTGEFADRVHIPAMAIRYSGAWRSQNAAGGGRRKVSSQ